MKATKPGKSDHSGETKIGEGLEQKETKLTKGWRWRRASGAEIPASFFALFCLTREEDFSHLHPGEGQRLRQRVHFHDRNAGSVVRAADDCGIGSAVARKRRHDRRFIIVR